MSILHKYALSHITITMSQTSQHLIQDKPICLNRNYCCYATAKRWISVVIYSHVCITCVPTCSKLKASIGTNERSASPWCRYMMRNKAGTLSPADCFHLHPACCTNQTPIRDNMILDKHFMLGTLLWYY